MFAALLLKTGLPQWAAEMLLGALVVIALAGGGYYKGHCDAANADALAQQKAAIAYQQKLQALQAQGDALAGALAAEQAKTHVQYQTITKEVPHVVTYYRASVAAPLQPLPPVVFTVGFKRLWNCALNPDAILPAGAGCAADAAGGSDPAADDLDSGLTEAAIIDNHVDNAEACTGIRQQLNALIDWHEQVLARLAPKVAQ
jgi:hypothetical protein